MNPVQESQNKPSSLESPDEKLPQPSRGKKVWLKRTLYAFLVLMLVSIGFSIWLVRTNAGLHFAAFRLPAWFGVHVSAKNLDGTMWEGFSADSLLISKPEVDISLSSLKFVWQSQKIWQRTLWIDHISLGHLNVKTTNLSPKESPPLKLPESISLPLNIHLGQLSLSGLTLGKSKDALILASSVSYTYQDEIHQLTMNRLQLPWGQGVGKIKLNGKEGAPFALNGNIVLNGVLDGVKAEGKVTLSGSLKEPKINSVLIGSGVAVEVLAALSPFAPQLFEKISRLEVAAGNINPKAFWDSAPTGNISTSFIVRPAEGALRGQFVYANTSAAAFQEGGIPIALIVGDLSLKENGILSLKDITFSGLHDGKGILSGQVNLSKQMLNLGFLVENVQLRDMTNSPLNSMLNGNIKASGTFTKPQVHWDLNTEHLLSQGKLQVTQNEQGQVLSLSDAHLSVKKGGKLSLLGSLNLYGEQTVKLLAQTQNFNPNTVLSSFPVGNITARLNLDGHLGTDILLNSQLQISPSILSGASLNGHADILLRKKRFERANIDLNLGHNRIQTSGSLGGERDALKLNINAPNLVQFGFGLAGSLNLNGSILGKFKTLTLNLQGSAQKLQYGKEIQLQELKLIAKASPDLKAPLNIQVEGRDLMLQDKRINQISLLVNGTGMAHKLSAKATLKLDKKDYQLNLAAQGGLNPAYAWQGRLQTLDLKGAINLLLQHPVNLDIASDHLLVGNARWEAFGGSLNLEKLSWQQGQSLVTKGSINNLQIAQIMNLLPKTRIEPNLVIRGEWDLSYSNNASGFIRLYRQSGDIAVPVNKTRKHNLGINQLDVGVKLQGARINLNLDAKTEIGSGSAKLTVSQNYGSNLMRAPLEGNLILNVPDLQVFRLYFPVSMQIKGRVNTNIKIGGTAEIPSLTGMINGDDLWFREQESGLRLGDGTLRAKFEGRKLILEQLKFISTSTRRKMDAQGETVRRGEARAQGVIQMVGDTPDVNIDIIFDHFSAFDKPNRRLVVSGKNNFRYNLKENANLLGSLKVDFGRFDLPKAGTPTLDNDVVVAERATKQTGESTPINIDLSVDLGDKFKFSGQGLNVRLGGKIRVMSKAGQDIMANGQINLLDGRYKAYGQDLDIEKGIIAFVGPIANPVLNLRAVRRQSPVGAGVEVTGTVAVPRINLIANEPMSQKDKLAWLVLGHATGGEDDDSALAASAGAWLAGSINDRVGFLDDVGISSRKQRTLKNGEVSPAEQFLTAGKYITKEIYVGYEYGLNSADMAVKIAYQISKAWQFIVRTGEDSSSVETRYSIRFD